MNPTLTLTQLDPKNIVDHIEYVSVADMTRIVQSFTSADFMQANQSQKNTNNSNNIMSEFYGQLQERVKEKLSKDFEDCGIELVRLNVETPKILDKKIVDKMAEFSLINTETRAKETVLERQYNIARQEAAQAAVRKSVEQQQLNENLISQSKAQLEATKHLNC